MLTKATTTLVSLALSLALGACGRGEVTQAGSTGSTAGSTGGEPWGRTLLSTSVTEDGRPRPLVDGTRITFTFSSAGEPRLGAQAGCNQMGGAASFEDGRLVVGDLATTEMGCDPPRHSQDDWMGRFLTSRPQWTMAGSTLTLDNGTTRVTLDDKKTADPDRPLRGTKWVVDTVVDGESASSVPAGAEADVVFGDDDRFTGSTGCNAMGGKSAVHDHTSTITFSEVITTKMACDDDRMRLERAVLATLAGDVTYRIDAATLGLGGPKGHGLRLHAAG
ncbi:MAG TPA: META domain-containing protein [Acidimicrobiia bacterium]|nr:META domain-containing protein [Acidimicrobiia bacterium]